LLKAEKVYYEYKLIELKNAKNSSFKYNIKPTSNAKGLKGCGKVEGYMEQAY
jgi:hypothetical protein